MEHSVEVIKNNISKSLTMYGINHNSRIEYNGKALEYTWEEDDYQNYLRIWIRLIKVDTDRYIVDISSIELPQNKRRSGAFKTIFDRLKRCKYVHGIKITSVCTTEMLNWCKKNNLNQLSFYDFMWTSKS